MNIIKVWEKTISNATQNTQQASHVMLHIVLNIKDKYTVIPSETRITIHDMIWPTLGARECIITSAIDINIVIRTAALASDASRSILTSLVSQSPSKSSFTSVSSQLTSKYIVDVMSLVIQYPSPVKAI